jgi:hypothetical protein
MDKTTALKVYTYMQTPLELAVSSQLHTNYLVDEQADEIERLRNRVTLLAGLSHEEQSKERE